MYSLMANIAQIVILVIVLPVFFLLFGPLLKNNSIFSLLIGFQDTNFFKYVAEIAQDYDQANSFANGADLSVSLEKLFNELILNCLGESLVGGLVITFMTTLWRPIKKHNDRMHRHILPIIPITLGSFFACILLGWKEAGASIAGEIAVLMIIVFGMKIALGLRNYSDLPLTVFVTLFGLIVNCGISAAFTSAFSLIILYSNSKISSFSTYIIVPVLLIMGIVMLGIEYLISEFSDKDDSVL